MRIQDLELLTDEDWAERLQELHFIRQSEKKATEN